MEQTEGRETSSMCFCMGVLQRCNLHQFGLRQNGIEKGKSDG